MAVPKDKPEMPLNDRQNILRAIRFERPDYIPVVFHINAACWHHYDQQALQDLMEEHRFLFPGFVRREHVEPQYAPNELHRTPYTDPWGCVWETMDDGITGSVRHHPVAEWSRFATFHPPDPAVTDGTFPIDWAGVRARAMHNRSRNSLVSGTLPHGHTFLRLADIRGYENLMVDMAAEEPRLARLIDLVEEFNYDVVLRWLKMEPDIMCFPDDLGMQEGPMISPLHFRTYIMPVYRSLMQPVRDSGCIIHMHADGDIRMLVDDILSCGVQVVNLQDHVNGIGWIAQHLAGHACIDLDIDRQQVTVHGTGQEIDAMILNEIRTLGSKEGGLMMIYGLYPGVPLRNIKALMDALERYAGYFS